MFTTFSIVSAIAVFVVLMVMYRMYTMSKMTNGNTVITDPVYTSQWVELPASAWVNGVDLESKGDVYDINSCKAQCDGTPACTGYAWHPTHWCHSFRGATSVYADVQNGGWAAGIKKMPAGVFAK